MTSRPPAAELPAEPTLFALFGQTYLAITFHRSKRSKRMTASALDAVPGLGEHRRKALVTHFGSVARLKQASVEEITSVPGIGVTTAAAVLAALGVPPDAGQSAGSTPNAAEVRDDGVAERASG